MRRIFKIILYIFLFILLVLLAIAVAIQTPYVQTEISKKVLSSLNTQFGTAIKVGEVDVDFFGDINLYDVSAQDHHELDFIHIARLKADINLWDLYQNSNDIRIDDLDLHQAHVQVITYPNEETSNFIQFIDKFVIEEDNKKENSFKLQGNLEVINSQLSIINQNLEANQKVWLEAKQLNAIIKNIDLEGDTYKADIKQIYFDAVKNKEKYSLHKLAGLFTMNNKGIALEDVIVDTQSSYLSGDIIMNFDSIQQFADFGNKVKWNIHLEKDNRFGYKDLRYFVPSWKKDIVFNIHGTAKGPINNLNFQDFYVANGATHIQTDNLDLRDVYDAGINIHTNHIVASTSYEELQRILPAYISQDITSFVAKLGTVAYQGALQLDQEDLYAKGKAKSALGNAVLDLTLNNYSGNKATYHGNVQTNQFNLQKLTDTQELGMVSGQLIFDGYGYDLQNMRIQTQGNLNYLDIYGDRYQNIAVNGVLNHQVFDGILAIHDPNAQLTYDGILDFSKKHLKLQFDSQIEYINLTHFGLSKKNNTWLRANVIADAQFSNINNLEGHIELQDLVFNTDTINLSLPLTTLDITSSGIIQKQLVLDVPDYLNANIDGTFQLDELPDVLQNGFGNFLVGYEHKKVTPNQVFDFNIELKENLVSYFVPDLYLQPTTIVRGTTNDKEKLFEFDMHSPFIQYDSCKANDVNVRASTTAGQSFLVEVEKLDIQDMIFQQFVVDGQKLNDSIVANSHFYAGEDKYGEFNLNFYQTFGEDLNAIKTGFASSQIKLDQQVWEINPNNQIDSNYAIVNFEEMAFNVNNILLQSDDQKLRLNGDYLNADNYELDADLENLDLAKLLPSFIDSEFKIQGIANGNIDIIKTENELKPVADFRIDSIHLNNYYIGNFVTTASYQVEEEIFDIEGSLDRDNVNKLFLTGSIDNQGDKPELDMVANLDDMNISVLGVFLDDVLSHWQGELSGDLSIKGDPSDPEMQGYVTGEDIGFKVVFLGTTYQMQGENDFVLSKSPGTNGFLTLPYMDFTETNSNTHGTLEGNLIFSSISDWFLDLEFEADRLMVMNTTVEDNELFYGRVFGRGSFEMFGPATDLEIYAHDVDVLNGSSISLNTGGTSSVEDKRFIQFYAYDETGQLIEDEEKKAGLSGVTLDFSLNVDQGTDVNLVLDAQTDDAISARGRAEDFLIQMNKAGKLNIEGEFIVNSGTYNYREYLVVDKDFEIEEGGYIRFNGDPYNAELNVRAMYSRYVNNVGDYLGLSNNQPTEVDLVIAITGNLENTEINFDIETPRAGSQITSALNSRLSATTDELMKQASFLLVLGRFGTDELLSTETATGAATASAFELLGKQVGNIFSSIIPGLEINPTYLQSTNRNQESDRIQTQLNWAINDRLRINGAVGAPVGTEFNEVVTTQVELDYDISENADGGLILRGFSRPTTLGIENYNYNSTYAQSYGAGVIYNKSFNSFKELFNVNKKKDTIIDKSKDSALKRESDTIIKNKFSYIQFNK